MATTARSPYLYCLVAQGALVWIHIKVLLLTDHVANNHRSAPISERHRTMQDFALYRGLEVGLTD